MTALPRALEPGVWSPLAQAHREHLQPWVGPHLERRSRGETHPVHDFLFTYYSERPARLLRWHPGAGRALLGPEADERLGWRHYACVDALDGDGRSVRAVGLNRKAFLADRASTVQFVLALLRATASRPAQLGCFGLHEWAMLHRAPAPRHGAVPLRLGSAGTDAVVEQAQLRCTHHDAFRFFTPEAVPLNAHAPTREQQVALEQPGCLHAAMDLYKWAAKLAPAVPGELLADCFVLAAEVRELDMRASPYDLTALGFEAVAVETAQGRAAYVAAQRSFADRAAVLRARLVAVCEDLLGAVPAATAPHLPMTWRTMT